MELKHIAPYLPYKTIGISKQGTFFYLSTGCNMRGNGIEDRDIGTWVSNGIKPILHPLSDLAKEIEINGEKFVPIDNIPLKKPSNQFYEDLHGIAKGTKDVFSFPYYVIQKLIEWKFDVFNLIGQVEAIDVNTLTTNPYL